MFLKILQIHRKTTVLEPLLEACNFTKKETLAQVLSSQFCEIFQSTFFTEHLRTPASAFWRLDLTVLRISAGS